jgi:cytochrome o ubiquinol oxidase subunit 1
MGAGLAASYAVFVWFAWRDVHDRIIPADVVARIDRERRAARARWLEQHPENEATT